LVSPRIELIMGWSSYGNLTSQCSIIFVDAEHGLKRKRISGHFLPAMAKQRVFSPQPPNRFRLQQIPTPLHARLPQANHCKTKATAQEIARQKRPRLIDSQSLSFKEKDFTPQWQKWEMDICQK